MTLPPLGQFVPGESMVHRLDPRVKIAAAVLLSLVILNAAAPGAVLITLFLAGSFALTGLGPGLMARALRPLAWFFLLLFCLHVFFTEGRPIAAGIPAITVEGLERGILVTWQFVALIASAAILTMTTQPSEMVGGLERLLRPLDRIGVPSHDISLMISLALRFVPALAEESERIREAQAARGANYGGPLTNRLKKTAGLVIPLLLSTFRRADELATAMEGRGYHRGSRTYLRELKFKRFDYAALTLVAVFLIGVETLRRLT